LLKTFTEKSIKNFEKTFETLQSFFARLRDKKLFKSVTKVFLSYSKRNKRIGGV